MALSKNTTAKNDKTRDESTQDSPVQVYERKDTIVGQPQARTAEPHDGSTLLHEIVVHTDQQILDPNADNAVQVPEGVGASTVGESPALSALQDGTAEQQFAKEREGSTTEHDDRFNEDKEVVEHKDLVQPEDTGRKPSKS